MKARKLTFFFGMEKIESKKFTGFISRWVLFSRDRFLYTYCISIEIMMLHRILMKIYIKMIFLNSLFTAFHCRKNTKHRINCDTFHQKYTHPMQTPCYFYLKEWWHWTVNWKRYGTCGKYWKCSFLYLKFLPTVLDSPST